MKTDSGKEVIATVTEMSATAPAASCVMCEYAMAEVDKRILTNSTEVHRKQ